MKIIKYIILYLVTVPVPVPVPLVKKLRFLRFRFQFRFRFHNTVWCDEVCCQVLFFTIKNNWTKDNERWIWNRSYLYFTIGAWLLFVPIKTRNPKIENSPYPHPPALRPSVQQLKNHRSNDNTVYSLGTFSLWHLSLALVSMLVSLICILPALDS